MRVSIIVPTLNEESQIVGTIRSIQRLSGEKEIIVVDGGSTDQTVPLACAQNVLVLKAPQGRGMQMHVGVLESTGDVLWFLHADTIPPPNALEHIRKNLETRSSVGGNFGLLFDGPSRAARQLTAIYPLLRIFGLCYGDSGIFVRQDVYHQIGGFRPLPLFEDLDLLRRLRRAGRFVHLNCRIITSSRRFEQRNFALMWLHLDDVAIAVLVRSFTELALPMVLSRSSRERDPVHSMTSQKSTPSSTAPQLLATEPPFRKCLVVLT